MAASQRLLAKRLRNPGLANDVPPSSTWLARLAVTGDEAVIEVVPAPEAEEVARLRPIAFGRWAELPRWVLQVGSEAPLPCRGAALEPRMAPSRATVSLGDAPPAEPAAARLGWPLHLAAGTAASCSIGDAGLTVTLPQGASALLSVEFELRLRSCHLPARLCDRWARGDDPPLHYARVTLTATVAAPAADRVP